MYIFIYIYIYIYIGWTRWNGDTTSKNKLFFATSFSCGRSQGICQICDLQVLKDIWCHFMTDFLVILDHMQEQKVMEVNRKSAWNWFNLDLGSGQVVLKSQVSLSRNFLTVLAFLLMSLLMSCECFLVVLW